MPSMATHQVSTNASDSTTTTNDNANTNTTTATANATATTNGTTATATATQQSQGATVEPTTAVPGASEGAAADRGVTVRTRKGGEADVELDAMGLDEKDADASLLAIGTKNELPLQFRWALWYSAPKSAQADAAHKWDTKRAKQIVEFGSVEEFWRVFNNLTPPSKLLSGSDLQLFRAGVQPAWEDPFNAKGGSWTIKITKDDSDKLDTVWFNTVLTMIGDNFDDADDICGLTVSSRPKYNRVQLWTRYADDPIVSKRIGQQLKDMNRLKNQHKIQFLSHDDAKDNSRDSRTSEIIL